MDVTKTNYGLLVTIPEQHDTNGDLLNSEFSYQLRQVRTINDNDPDEQPLINALEKREKRDTAKFLKLAEEMERLFKQLRTREDWQAWVKLEKMLARDWGRLWRGYYMVDIPLSGQGNRRTRMAEAACNSLRAAGYNATMFYQCD